MSTIDQQFVEYIVKSIVGNPDDVVVDRTIDEKGVLLKLTVNQEDLGRVIGKRGGTAQSIRTLLRALGTKNEARYNLKIVDVEGSRPAPVADAPAETSEAPAESAPVVEAEPVADETAETDEPVAVEPEKEPAKSDLASKTRKELADLDDLDI